MADVTGLASFLAYGAIGLGLALAALTYLLLRQEQSMAKPRREMLKAIYIFMGFALALSGGGFGIELVKSKASAVEPLQADLQKKVSRLAEVEMQLATAKAAMIPLLDQKTGKLRRLLDLDPQAPQYPAMVREFQRDLVALDDGLRSSLR